MSGDSSEDLAAEFLEQRERDPGLTPEAFSAAYPDQRDAVWAAIRAALDASDLLPPEDDAASHPVTVGAYRVIRVLGRGGMGVVYEVERDGVRFAMKRIPLAPVVGPRLLERFRRESAILARLSHPNIVRVHDSGIQDEAPYLVMDLVDGPALGVVSSVLPLAEKVKLVAVLCRAVHAAHEAGVVHRDLKPQNVVLRRDGSPVLLDFGLGAAEEFPTMTSSGDLLGTPRYMAPEQVRDSEADRRTDVYGLGAILYELAVGAPAHPERSREKILDAIRVGRVRRPRRVAQEVPRELEKIILTAVAFDRRHRFPTAAAMADDLERFLAGVPVLAGPPGIAVRAWQWLRLNPARAAAAFFAVAAIVAGIWLALTPKALGPSRIREANLSFNAGVAAWLDGDEGRAKAALAQALEKNPGHASAAALASALSGAPAAEVVETPLGSAVAAFRASRFADVQPAVEKHLGNHERDVLTSVLLGFAALEQRDFERAEKDLAAAASDLPPSRRIAEARGKAQRRLGRLDESVASYRQALAIGPETSETWLALAEVYRQQQDLDRGIEAAETAVRLSGKESGKAGRMLASLYNGKGDHAKAQQLLEEILERNPTDVEAQFNLAVSFDSAHAIVEAEAAYRRVLELKREHPIAMMNLANLYSGADRGPCKGCNRAYAEHPEFLRPDEAERLLVESLRLDQGKSKSLVQIALGISARLPDRGGIVKTLHEMTDGKEKTPAVLNLEWLLRRLELNEGAPASR